MLPASAVVLWLRLGVGLLGPRAEAACWCCHPEPTRGRCGPTHGLEKADEQERGRF